MNYCPSNHHPPNPRILVTQSLILKIVFLCVVKVKEYNPPPQSKNNKKKKTNKTKSNPDIIK